MKISYAVSKEKLKRKPELRLPNTSSRSNYVDKISAKREDWLGFIFLVTGWEGSLNLSTTRAPWMVSNSNF